MHSLWISLVVPVMLCVFWAVPESRRRSVWTLCIVAGLLGVLGLIGFEYIRHLNDPKSLGFGMPRAIYAILASIDFPFIALCIGGSITWVMTWFVGARSSASQPVVEEPFSQDELVHAEV